MLISLHQVSRTCSRIHLQQWIVRCNVYSHKGLFFKISHKIFQGNHISVLANRLSNFQIGTTNTSPRQQAPKLSGYDVCATNAGALNAGETRHFACSSTGRYLIVQLKGTNYLTLCEVKVFASKFSHKYKSTLILRQSILLIWLKKYSWFFKVSYKICFITHIIAVVPLSGCRCVTYTTAFDATFVLYRSNTSYGC